MTAQVLIGRLKGVRKTGELQWIAKCPSHQDKSPSLTVREMPDGRVLVHCFAGCGAIDVLESLGLSWDDVFPNKLEVEKINQRTPATWALETLRGEAVIVALCANDIQTGKQLSKEDVDRVFVAAGRIADIVRRVYGGA